MLVDEIWDFKSINMGCELSIAGEFIYDSARKAMSLYGLDNNYELNAILYNGAVGIERLQKIYLCLAISDPTDKSTVPSCLLKHNHIELEDHVKEYSASALSANGRGLLGVFCEYYNNYRYGNYVPGNGSRKLRDSFISFLKKQNGKFDFEKPFAAVQFEPFKQFYINELGNTAKYYYNLINEKAREINTYTYELDSNSNATRVFWSTQRRSLYRQMVIEQEAVKELLLYFYKGQGKSGVFELLKEMQSLEFDDALVNDYLADLCEGKVNDVLIDWVEDMYEEIEGKDDRKERHELVSLIGNRSVLFGYEYGAVEGERLVILGSGGYGRTVADLATQLGYEIIVLDDLIPEHPLSSYTDYIGKAGVKFIPAFGNNEFRLEWICTLQNHGAELATLIHPTAYISPASRIYEGTVVLPHAVVNTDVEIGRGCIVNVGSIVDHGCVIEEGVHLCLGCIVKGENRVRRLTKIEAGEVIEARKWPV